MNTSIKQLSSGYEVEVRAVPPTAYLDVELDFNRNHPPPKRPMIALKSVAGHTEEFPATMNTPEWATYDNELELHKADLMAAQINFAYNYAVVVWRRQWKQEPMAEWNAQPPDDWQPDELCPDKTSHRRVLFIKYELISNSEDEKAISKPFATAPLTDEEVDAAIGKFRTDTAPEEVAKRPGKRQRNRK